MKFRDIEEFPAPIYFVNVPVKNLRKSLEELSGSGYLDLDPPYQRSYVWTEEQKIKYLQYFFRGGSSGKHIYLNQVKWNEGEGPLSVIDGKQRLSAFFDFFDNKIPIFGHYFSEFEDVVDPMKSLIVHVNDLSEVEAVKWYLQMNTGGTYHTEEDIKLAKDYYENLVYG